MSARKILEGFAIAVIAAAPTPLLAESVLTAMPLEATAWVENYNPYNMTTRLPSVQDFMYEPLIVFNAMQNGEPNFRLATEYQFADDLKSVTIKLRPGVKWSDGEAFDAADVAFTFNMIKEHKALDLRAIWDQITGFEVVDDHTVRFDLKDVNTGIVFQLAQVYVVPEHIWSKVEDPVTFTNLKPVGTGPLTEITRFTTQEYIQCRNPNYWDNATLKVDCMRFPQVANNDQALAIAATGELDWFGSFLPDIEKTYVAQDPENHGYWFPAGSMVYFALNFETKNEGNKKAFNDINFRHAFSMAMDRQAMVDIAGYGYPTINEYPSGLGRAFHSWNNAEVDAKYGEFSRYNIEEAKKILADAGYKDTDGDGFVETPDGLPISFDIIVPNGWTDWVNSVQLAVEGLSEIGVSAKVATPEEPVWQQKLTDADYDAAIDSHFVGPNPFMHFNGVLHSRNQGKTRFAPTRYSNPELDKLLDAFYATADAKKQAEVMSEIQMMIGTDMPFVAVFNNPLWYQYNTKRFEGWFNADNPVANPVVHDNQPTRLLHLLALKPKG